MLLAKLNSTPDCIKLGKHLTMEQAVELKRLREICVISSEKWLNIEHWGLSGIMATKSQFCRETIQSSVHAEAFNLKPLTDLVEGGD